MLRARLEVVPFGDETRTYEIGKLEIYNKRRVLSDNDKGTLCVYGIVGHDETELHHFREDGAWLLVEKALSSVPIRGPN